MLERQKQLLDRMEHDNRNLTPGPLTRLLIQGRIDILNWFLTIQKVKGSDDSARSLDSRVMKQLQKQKDLLKEPINERKPKSSSKLEIQGRIEMLEWLLMN